MQQEERIYRENYFSQTMTPRDYFFKKWPRCDFTLSVAILFCRCCNKRGVVDHIFLLPHQVSLIHFAFFKIRYFEFNVNHTIVWNKNQQSDGSFNPETAFFSVVQIALTHVVLVAASWEGRETWGACSGIFSLGIYNVNMEPHIHVVVLSFYCI